MSQQKRPRKPSLVQEHTPNLLPVFVSLPWCEVWGAAPGGGRLTVSLDQRDLRWSWAHSSRSVTVLHPGWVKGWWSGPGSCRAAKQGLIHIGSPGLDPVAAGAAVLKVECLHSSVGQFHQDPCCCQWPRVTEGGLPVQTVRANSRAS